MTTIILFFLLGQVLSDGIANWLQKYVIIVILRSEVSCWLMLLFHGRASIVMFLMFANSNYQSL